MELCARKQTRKKGLSFLSPSGLTDPMRSITTNFDMAIDLSQHNTMFYVGVLKGFRLVGWVLSCPFQLEKHVVLTAILARYHAAHDSIEHACIQQQFCTHVVPRKHTGFGIGNSYFSFHWLRRVCWWTHLWLVCNVVGESWQQSWTSGCWLFCWQVA